MKIKKMKHVSLISLCRKLQKLGLKAQDTAELFFEDVSQLHSSHPNFFILSSFHRDQKLAHGGLHIRFGSGESTWVSSARSGERWLLSTDGTTPTGVFGVMIIIFLFLIGAADDWCPFCGNL